MMSTCCRTRCGYHCLAYDWSSYIHSKNISRDQQALMSEKELKTNSVRSASDDIASKRLRLGTLKSQQEKRLRDEAALRDLQESLAQLQAQMKVRGPHLWSLRRGS